MDEAAFQAFYQKTAPSLWSYLCRVTASASLAEDLVQEAFCRLLKSPPPRTEERELRAYLYRIASNLAIDHWRRARRETQWEAGPSEVGARQDLDRRYDLTRTFQQLKPQERILLWLAYVEGSGHREIAKALGLGEKSIRVLLFRARQKLARLLKKKGLGPEASR